MRLLSAIRTTTLTSIGVALLVGYRAARLCGRATKARLLSGGPGRPWPPGVPDCPHRACRMAAAMVLEVNTEVGMCACVRWWTPTRHRYPWPRGSSTSARNFSIAKFKTDPLASQIPSLSIFEAGSRPKRGLGLAKHAE